MEKCREEIPQWFDKEGVTAVVNSDTHEWEEKETVMAEVQTLKCKLCGRESSAWKKV